MTKKEERNKLPITVRVTPENRTGLDRLAEQESRKVSSLVDQAVEEFLVRRLGVQFLLKSILELDSTDVERAVPVMKAVGAPIPLQVFVDLIEVQRKASAT